MLTEKLFCIVFLIMRSGSILPDLQPFVKKGDNEIDINTTIEYGDCMIIQCTYSVYKILELIIMRCFKQLTQTDRVKLETLYEKKVPIKDIAKDLKKCIYPRYIVK